MADQVEKLQKQAVELWKKTVKQLDSISKSVMKASKLDQIHFGRSKLLEERDNLFKRLGQEAYKLIDTDKLEVPKPVQDIHKKIRTVMDRIAQRPKRAKAKKKKPAKKKATKRTTSKKKASKSTA